MPWIVEIEWMRIGNQACYFVELLGSDGFAEMMGGSSVKWVYYMTRFDVLFLLLLTQGERQAERPTRPTSNVDILVLIISYECLQMDPGAGYIHQV